MGAVTSPSAGGAPAPPASETTAAPAGGVLAAVERLWCAFGYHVPDSTLVWHQGYGFAKCRRCKRSIVRSLLSGWTVPPPSLKIVWDKAPTGDAPRASAPRPAAGGNAAPEKRSPDLKPQVAEGGDIVALRTSSGEAARRTDEPAASAQTPSTVGEAGPLLSVIEPEPGTIDLLGPHFMGDQGAPPGPSEGLSVFEFDDMGGEDDGARLGIAAQRGR